ncbi:MAG: antibiotic biosynthesis monooxygenase [Melioribacteraceae bacterium]|nr:antibiotic biosynthesis monooxygenase [Melioribacteraceae bacterium]
MKVSTVSVWVKEESITDFINATLENHEGSIKEPGNLRFDVLQNIDDPCRFTLYEAYDSNKSSAEHKKTAHYLKWKETVANMMVQPREGLHHKVLAPIRKDLW